MEELDFISRQFLNIHSWSILMGNNCKCFKYQLLTTIKTISYDSRLPSFNLFRTTLYLVLVKDCNCKLKKFTLGSMFDAFFKFLQLIKTKNESVPYKRNRFRMHLHMSPMRVHLREMLRKEINSGKIAINGNFGAGSQHRKY